MELEISGWWFPWVCSHRRSKGKSVVQALGIETVLYVEVWIWMLSPVLWKNRTIAYPMWAVQHQTKCESAQRDIIAQVCKVLFASPAWRQPGKWKAMVVGRLTNPVNVEQCQSREVQPIMPLTKRKQSMLFSVAAMLQREVPSLLLHMPAACQFGMYNWRKRNKTAKGRNKFVIAREVSEWTSTVAHWSRSK